MYTYENKEFSKESIIAIAKSQKFFLIFLLLRIVSYAVSGKIPLFGIGVLAFSVLTLVFFVKMMIEMKTGTATIAIRAILSLIPLLGLIILLVTNNNATKILKSFGIEVGLLGASDSAIRNFENS